VPDGTRLTKGLGLGDFSSTHFRAVLGHFCTGVAIITGIDGVHPVGLTCQSFVSLSLDPPLVAFAPSKASTSWPRIRRSGSFCVNVLGDEQADVSRAFAASGGDKFKGLVWEAASTGSPVLENSLAWIDCCVVAEHEAGDHVIVVGQVVNLAATTAGNPLLFYRGGYGRFAAP
jgi:flavin reductase (DIM6/NTAB) family NADH-FMN oxidoreductase RutF